MAQNQSRYQQRPGLFGTRGRLLPIEGSTGLRTRQERRIAQSCTLDSDHQHGVWLDNSGHRQLDKCNGVPWASALSRQADAAASGA